MRSQRPTPNDQRPSQAVHPWVMGVGNWELGVDLGTLSQDGLQPLDDLCRDRERLERARGISAAADARHRAYRRQGAVARDFEAVLNPAPAETSSDLDVDLVLEPQRLAVLAVRGDSRPVQVGTRRRSGPQPSRARAPPPPCIESTTLKCAIPATSVSANCTRRG